MKINSLKYFSKIETRVITVYGYGTILLIHTEELNNTVASKLYI